MAEQYLGTFAYKKFLSACQSDQVNKNNLLEIAKQLSYEKLYGNLKRNIERDTYQGRSTAKDFLDDWCQLQEGESTEPSLIMSVERLQEILRSDDVLLKGLANALVDNGGKSSVGLPAEWEEKQDANGRTYYVNHITRTMVRHIFEVEGEERVQKEEESGDSFEDVLKTTTVDPIGNQVEQFDKMKEIIIEEIEKMPDGDSVEVFAKYLGLKHKYNDYARNEGLNKSRETKLEYIFDAWEQSRESGTVDTMFREIQEKTKKNQAYTKMKARLVSELGLQKMP